MGHFARECFTNLPPFVLETEVLPALPPEPSPPSTHPNPPQPPHSPSYHLLRQGLLPPPPTESFSITKAKNMATLLWVMTMVTCSVSSIETPHKTANLWTLALDIDVSHYIEAVSQLMSDAQAIRKDLHMPNIHTQGIDEQNKKDCASHQASGHGGKYHLFSLTKKAQTLDKISRTNKELLIELEDLDKKTESIMVTTVKAHSLEDAENVFVDKAQRMLGFITRNTKNFKNIQTIKILYCSLVRPLLELSSPVWSPYYSVHIKAHERIQNRFLKLINFKLVAFGVQFRILGQPPEQRLTSTAVGYERPRKPQLEHAFRDLIQWKNKDEDIKGSSDFQRSDGDENDTTPPIVEDILRILDEDLPDDVIECILIPSNQSEALREGTIAIDREDNKEGSTPTRVAKILLQNPRTCYSLSE
ncbi:hypothetical protein J437_LFUL008125 [Ladona fulva]|uniref:Uncharacterized protein n=1 Tax=Ladona fulva TaxID=123851 RepID=A0A8K0JUS9_LADFU|nr:hypothetical protein J437_LFUL008125 [Ladona fulva]